MKSKTILVPMDFSPHADRALEHALEIAKVFDRNICLLNVVSDATLNTEKEKIKNKLKYLAKVSTDKTGIEVSHSIKEGSIFDVITSAISELSAGFVVMGYHGKKDIKHLTKGFAYSVISSSKVPVMIVKKSNRKIKDNAIIVPIDFAHEKLKKINKATKIARHFNCLIHVIGVIHSEGKIKNCDRQALLKRIHNHLEGEGLEFKAELLEKPKSILVPIDFTQVSKYAVNHAIEIAKLFDRKVVMLHITGKKDTFGDQKNAERKIRKFYEEFNTSAKVDITYEIKTGSIFSSIADTALEVSAEFIIMGIHGKKGMQHILGSYAYKIIKNSRIPIMVVKRDNPGKGYRNIVVSIDFQDESRVEVNTAIRFARYFGSKLHIIGVLESKSSAYKIKQEVLINNMINHVKSVGVSVKAEILTKTGSGVHERVLDYANRVDADLIMIVAKKGGTIAEVFGNNYSERLIDKSNIPVLSIIPYVEYDEEPSDTYSVGAFIDPFGLTR